VLAHEAFEVLTGFGLITSWNDYSLTCLFHLAAFVILLRVCACFFFWNRRKRGRINGLELPGSTIPARLF
jgi:hypothetical protein